MNILGKRRYIPEISNNQKINKHWIIASNMTQGTILCAQHKEPSPCAHDMANTILDCLEGKMKKKLVLILILAFAVILFSSCNSKGMKNDMVNYEVGAYHDKNWDETIGSYQGEVIPDKETALEMAKAIFNGMEKSKESQHFIPQSIFFDEKDEIWIVSFGKDSNEIILGGDCSIAMQKKDGKVLRIWFGE